ncbi:MAG: hypothetical protein IJ325_13955 [Clostridia bacterium]|nr:hypothetical protein [Clostridia bacterium]
MKLLLSTLYTKYGITDHTDYNRLRSADYPIMSDLYDLVDVDEEHDLATIVELNQGTLSVAGRSAWRDVLSAKVEGIFEGCYGTQIAVSGCDPQRLADFSFMLAGHCNAEDYDTWVNKHDQEQDIGPVLSM